MEVTYWLSKKKSFEINKLKDERENAFIKKFLKLEYSY